MARRREHISITVFHTMNASRLSAYSEFAILQINRDKKRVMTRSSFLVLLYTCFSERRRTLSHRKGAGTPPGGVKAQENMSNPTTFFSVIRNRKKGKTAACTHKKSFCSLTSRPEQTMSLLHYTCTMQGTRLSHLVSARTQEI